MTELSLAFDYFCYVKSLSWLGKPREIGGLATIEREFGPNHCDLRGSWPYQSLPTLHQVQMLADNTSALSYTFVVRPDVVQHKLSSEIKRISVDFSTVNKQLKDHLACMPNGNYPWDNYSKRTKQRLSKASTKFIVRREIISFEHNALSEWQRRLSSYRNIPKISTPDANHFEGIIQLGMDKKLNVCPMTLRWKENGSLAGLFILLSGQDGSWHAHSFLVKPEAISEHGAYLLFETTVKELWGKPIWFGGAPAGANGTGVFNFKKRFSNYSLPAHIVSIDLRPKDLDRIRNETGKFNWLPDYRDPKTELSQ